MGKRKRAWVEPNPKHPRSSKNGRFVKRGTGPASAAAGAAADGLKGLSGTKEPVKVTGPATLPKKGVSLARQGPKVIKPLAAAPAKVAGPATLPTKKAAGGRPKFRGGTLAPALNKGIQEADMKDVRAFMEASTNFTDPRTGMTARVTDVSRVSYLRADAPSSVDVRYEIRDRDGAVVGEAWRQWSPAGQGDWGQPAPTRVKHMEMHLAPNAQGNGFARAWNEEMEQTYRANGAEEIHLTANEDVGGYAWAKQGYDWADDEGTTVEDMAGRLKAVLKQPPGNWSAEDVAKMQTMLKRMQSGNPDKIPTPLELSMVGWTKGATMWPGKRFMLASAWEGVKKL